MSTTAARHADPKPASTEFFIETTVLPAALDPLDIALYGPTWGDGPIGEGEVTYAIRGARTCASRLIDRPVRKTRMITVIAGPHDGHACILFTAYGGPSTPREPGDLSLASWEQIEESRAFWKLHALAKG